MTISKGDKLPDVKLVKPTGECPEAVQSSDFFAGKKVALFAVPGAFTPTCSAKHLPGYVEKAADLKAKGVDAIACTSVNDAFVMGAWNKADGSDDITMLADGSGDPEWAALAAHFTLLSGTRQIIVADIEKVQTSCGFAVPLYEYQSPRETLVKWSDTQGEEGIRQYWQRKNTRSMDGLPTLIGQEQAEPAKGGD